MRINAVFSKKVSTGTYENEQFTATVETEVTSAFNNVAAVCDYLFGLARESVLRQIAGTTSCDMPETTMPSPTSQTASHVTIAPERPPKVMDSMTQEKAPEKPAVPEAPKAEMPKPHGNALAVTEKQLGMIRKMLREQFTDGTAARKWLHEKFGADSTTSLTRKTASRVIEALMDRKRKVA